MTTLVNQHSWMFILTGLLLQGTPSHADTNVSEAFGKCVAINDDKSRLKCFDDLAYALLADQPDVIDNIKKSRLVSSGQADQKNNRKLTSEFLPISLVDLKVDHASMLGKKILVKGYLQLLGEVALLKSEMMDMTPLYVQLKSLSRDTRKLLVTDCPSFCSVTIKGIVGQTALGSGIIATELVLD